MNIKFNRNYGFAGTTYTMSVNSEVIQLGNLSTNEQEAALEAVKILKQDYGVIYDANNVIFKWGRTI